MSKWLLCYFSLVFLPDTASCRLNIPPIVKPYDIIAFMEVFNRVLPLRRRHASKFFIQAFSRIRASKTSCACQMTAFPAGNYLLQMIGIPRVWIYPFYIKVVIHTQALQIRKIIQRAELS